MTVYDRWHKAPGPGDEPCREHSRGRARMFPSAGHGQGKRWQVRWYDTDGRQRKRNFRLREGANPRLHADAFDAQVRRDLDTGGYTDPSAGDITFRAYAEDWRKTRRHDTSTAGNLERRLRLHAYEDPAAPGSGRTPRGGVSIGQRRVGELARRPSLIAAWIAGMPLAGASARLVTGDVSAVFRAAVDDGIAPRDPTRASSVEWPRRGGPRARPWTAERVAAVSAALPGRYQVIPWLGAATGMRQGEMFGLAVGAVDFLRRVVHVRMQVKIVDGRLCFAPVKNRKPHDVPLPGGLAARLARHLELYPAAEVTLPWHDLRDSARHGRPVTAALVLSDGGGRALNRRRFADRVWGPALGRAGIPRSRQDGCHALRHTAASAWLRAGIDPVRVAAWLGDTPQVVLATYAHLMPGESGDDGRAAADAFLGAGGAADGREREALS